MIAIGKIFITPYMISGFTTPSDRGVGKVHRFGECTAAALQVGSVWNGEETSPNLWLFKSSNGWHIPCAELADKGRPGTILYNVPDIVNSTPRCEILPDVKRLCMLHETEKYPPRQYVIIQTWTPYDVDVYKWAFSDHFGVIQDYTGCTDDEPGRLRCIVELRWKDYRTIIDANLFLCYIKMASRMYAELETVLVPAVKQMLREGLYPQWMQAGTAPRR